MKVGLVKQPQASISVWPAGGTCAWWPGENWALALNQASLRGWGVQVPEITEHTCWVPVCPELRGISEAP